MLNNFQIQGNIIGFYESGHQNTEKRFVRFGVAQNFKANGQEKTKFVYITAFGKTFDLLQNHTTVGAEIIVEGYLDPENYIDDSGKKHYQMKLIASQIHFSKPSKYQTIDFRIEKGLPISQEEQIFHANFYEEKKKVKNSNDVLRDKISKLTPEERASLLETIANQEEDDDVYKDMPFPMPDLQKKNNLPTKTGK